MKKRRCSLRFATNEPPALRTPGKETPPMKEQSTETGTESRPVWESLGRAAAAAATLGGRSGGGLGPAPIRASRRGRSAAGLPKRVGQAAPAERDGGHDHGPPAPRPRAGGALREPAAAAVQAAHRGRRPAA